jgi:predicted transport protein
MLRLFILYLSIFTASFAFSQDKVTVSGVIKSEENGETLFGAKISIPELAKAATANEYGFYSLTVVKGEFTIDFSAPGMMKETRRIRFINDTTINISLKIPSKQIDEVIVSAKKSANVESANMGQIELGIDEIKKLPAFMGEVDPVKIIQLLPGVSSVSEGGQGFYVRGGGPDQNLVLLDEAVVYNASHLFGFFSVFNPDAVKNVNLIKGGMPANFGGRLSSVLEVNMIEGNKKDYSVKGGIGLIASRLSVEGPIKKDKGSFMISGRRTYVDLLMKAFIPKSSTFRGSSYYFYDLNFKANYQLSDKDHLYLSGYFGRDEFKYDNKKDNFMVSMPWQNGAASLRWTHLFNRKLFMKVVGTYSHYNFSFGSEQDDIQLKLTSGINDVGSKVEFSYFPTNNRHVIRFGGQYTYHIFRPTSVSAQQDTTIFDTGLGQRLFSHETGLYLIDEWDITENLKLNTGLRYSTYTHTGRFVRYIKGNIGQPDTTITYKKGETIAFYHGLEPRVSLRYMLPDKSSIKAGFAYNYQYTHLASISAVSLPTDIWHPTTDVAKPQSGWQAALGYYRNFSNDMFESSVELYYKGMNNLVEFKEGALPTDNVNDNTDNILTFGKGWSYGVELFFKKTRGKFTGWVGYTWAKTERKFEKINDGKTFPAKYDRRHDLSVVASYDINKRWNVGASFIFATGNTMTLPSAWYMHNQDLLFQYSDRNASRMAPYHRLDLSVTFYDKEFKEKRDPATGEMVLKKKRFRNNWVLSVYNLYSRANPFFLYIDNDGSFANGDFSVKVKQVSLFPIIPGLTWNFEF